MNLANILGHIKGASFVGIDTVTNVGLKGGKKNPMQGRVTKVTLGSQCMFFTNSKVNGYEAMVKRRLAQEGKDPESFELKPRKWGNRIPDSPFVQHTKDGEQKFYLEVIFMKPGESYYMLDGQQIEKSKIEGLDTAEDKEPTGQAGLENQVIIRTYSVDSIAAMRAEGYEFIGPFQVEI